MKKNRSSTRKQKSVSGNYRSAPTRKTRRVQVAKPGSALPVSSTSAAGSTEPHMAQSPPFRIDSKPKRYTSIIGIVFGIGIVSIYFYIDILMKLHNFYTLLFVIPLYGYVFGDVIMWLWSGVRAVEVDVSGLKIIYPDGHPAKHIKLSEIGNIRIASSVDGKTVNILFHGAISKKVLWMDFFSGPRVRIPEAPFDKKEFAELVHRIAAITPIPQ